MGHKKLKGYIKDDRPRKLKSYIEAHGIHLQDVSLGHRRSLLHYCAEYGSADMLRCLLKLGCNPSLQDRDGNLALHTAIQRGLDEEVPQARETLVEMVDPLLDAYPLGQDVENKEGVTGHDLLTSLKKKIKSASSFFEAQSQRETGKIKEEEDEMWRQKLNEEAMFEFEEQLPRYQYDEDFHQERTTESYDDWSERVRKEYSAKQQNRHRNTFSRDKKRKSGRGDGDEGSSSKKSRTETSEEEKLRRAREEMRKNFKPDMKGKENSTERLLAKKKKYESKFIHLLNHLSGRTLTFACIPWPSLDLESVGDVLFCDFQDRKSDVYRKYLRAQQVRWHPDKFTQKFRDHLHPDHVPKIMSRVKAISQILNKLSADAS